MRQRLIPAAYALFVVGGLLSGTLGVHHMATFADDAQVSRLPKNSSTTDHATPAPVVQSLPARLLVEVSNRAPQPTATPVAENLKGSERWSLLYVLGGDLWQTTPEGPLQLTHDGHIGQPALGEGALAFVERSRNASDIWLASADGPPWPITRNSVPTISQNHWATQPAFLPGRQRLYGLGDFNKSTTGVGDLAVWELGLDLTPPVQITRPPAYAGGDQDVTIDPVDPRQIVFTRYAYAGSQLIEQLQWLDVSTDRLVPLTPPDQSSRQATYSPDGTSLAFVQRTDGAQENLYVAHLQLADIGPHLEDPQHVATGVIANPVWCPDASSLIYIAMAGDRFEVWSVDVQRDADGAETFGGPRQMTNGPGVDASSRPVCTTPELADQVRQWLTPAPP
ncbi:MAG: PD40 domain-containing protein [Chloroflexi bacterium]|nr:PD40 domain-containing protein [Chloroflexota bacterium]